MVDELPATHRVARPRASAADTASRASRVRPTPAGPVTTMHRPDPEDATSPRRSSSAARPTNGHRSGLPACPGRPPGPSSGTTRLLTRTRTPPVSDSQELAGRCDWTGARSAPSTTYAHGPTYDTAGITSGPANRSAGNALSAYLQQSFRRERQRRPGSRGIDFLCWPSYPWVNWPPPKRVGE